MDNTASKFEHQKSWVFGNIEPVLKFLATIVGLLTLGFGILKWTDSRNFDARKPFLTKQLTLYSEVTQVASKLATLDDKSSGPYRQALIRFKQLYWGELALVENAEVERCMVEMALLLGGKNPLRMADGKNKNIQKGALDLAHAIRKSLDESWRIDVWSRDGSKLCKNYSGGPIWLWSNQTTTKE